MLTQPPTSASEYPILGDSYPKDNVDAQWCAIGNGAGPALRHIERANITFADGHTESVGYNFITTDGYVKNWTKWRVNPAVIWP